MFFEARLKVDRAAHHIADLHRAIQTIAPLHSHEILVEYDPERGCDSLYVPQAQAIPESVSLILGDAVHNLRTSLDYALYCIRINPGDRCETKFPSHRSSEELKSMAHKRLEGKIPDRVIDFIVNIVQPYKGGNGEAIYSLHNLDIRDKHRLLIAKMQLTVISGICYKDQAGKYVTVPNWVLTNRRIGRYPCIGQRNIEITDKGKSASTIVFGNGMPLEGSIVVPTLSEIAETVSKTIDGIGQVFFGIE